MPLQFVRSDFVFFSVFMVDCEKVRTLKTMHSMYFKCLISLMKVENYD